MAFRDRAEAGEILAQKLSGYRDRDDVVVLGLPRGGVPVAFEVAKALRAPLDVFAVRKLGLPGHEELAMGAIASGGITVLNPEVVDEFAISSTVLASVVEHQRRELERRERAYRGNRPPLEIEGRIPIIIDDGLATGATMKAAVEAARTSRPRRIVVAVPVAAIPACEEFRGLVDEVVCAVTPVHFVAVGMWYEDFLQTSDEDVKSLLAEADRWTRHPVS